ncbi:MAG: hypothetical protein CV088_21505 [Nitrospira sp. LK70]|nr:hypothetical protein [Nitrospira sp. LK70]
MHHSLVILGSGYTAKFFLPLAQNHYSHIFATSRDPDRHLSHLRPDQRIRFDLARPDTWQEVPTSADVLWCFPAVPTELVQRFAEAASLRTRRLVVLGSTSAYGGSASAEYPPPWIDETASVDLTKPRVQGEELLRSSYDAVLLRVAGIYGPGRNPVDWIKTRRAKNSRKYVNLIHVEDLAVTCLAALAHGEPGSVYNVSDGDPRTWMEICKMVEQRWDIRAADSQDADSPGKRVSNKRLCELLKLYDGGLRCRDLFETIELMHQNSLNEATPSR